MAQNFPDNFMEVFGMYPATCKSCCYCGDTSSGVYCSLRSFFPVHACESYLREPGADEDWDISDSAGGMG